MVDQWSSILSNILNVIPSIATPILGLLAGWLVARTPKKGAAKQSQIDQLQEDISGLREHAKSKEATIQSQDSTIQQQRNMMSLLMTRDFAWREQVWILEQHINEGKGPPAPAKKEILLLPITKDS